MIKEIKLENWKSFKELSFKPEGINILVGNNGSGKTNFLDFLEFLKLKGQNASIEEFEKIRGGIKFFNTFNNEIKNMNTTIITEENSINFDLNIKDKFTELMEFLNDKDKFVKLIGTSKNKEELEITKFLVTVILHSLLTKSRDNLSIEKMLQKLEKEDILQEIKVKFEEFEKIKNELKNITILDPIAREIRGERKISEENYIKKDCSNIISLITQNEKKDEIIKKLLDYLKLLLGENIVKLEFVYLGKNKELCQLYLYEKTNNQERKLHSDIISDGTLRFIAIISSVLLKEEGTILAIEEFDNGIAPSKSKLLLDILDELSSERKIDIILTTHNTTLMNYMSKTLFEYVFFVYKDKNGYSHIQRIRDIPRVSKLMSYGEIGNLMEENNILEFLEMG